jgi:uncharacterized protein (DUF2267 family)
MSTVLAVFDTTVQDSNLWLKDIEAQLDGSERQEAYAALRAVLHALRDRLSAQAAVNFAAQLPMLLRGLFFEGWTLPEKPVRTHNEDDFLANVQVYLPPRYRFDALSCTRIVFATTAKFTSTDEARKLMAQVPEHVRALWPQPVLL